MKVWAKVMRGDKILRDVIYEGEHKPSFGGFREAVQSVAYLADVSTPVLLPAHYERFEHFNRVKFVPSDFIEEVDFTAFILERVKEDKPERRTSPSATSWASPGCFPQDRIDGV